MRIDCVDGRYCLYQWDVNQRLVIDERVPEGTQVHFVAEAFPEDTEAPVVVTYMESGVLYANIPNKYLQRDGRMTAYIYVSDDDDLHTALAVTITVKPRKRPASYVYTETEIINYQTLIDRLAEIEANGILAAEEDPTVPDWAKQPEKPKYTADEVGALPVGTPIPGKTSELASDSGFITQLVGDLANYYTKQQTYTRDEFNAKLTAIPKFAISVVDALPSAYIDASTVYLLKAGNASGDLYTEYIFANGAWEVLGSQKVDLTGYATEQWVNKTIADFLTKDKIVDVLGFTPVSEKRVEQLDKAIAEQQERTVPTYTLAEGESPEDAPEWAEEVIDPYNDPDGGGSAGGANIDVTAAVGQTIVVKEVDADGKPTKWESADHQPRTHWVEHLDEPVWTEIYPERTIIGADGQIILAMSDIGLTAGHEYRVKWNGTAYTTTAIGLEIEDGEENIAAVALGDAGAMEGEPTGEYPFLIATVPMDGVVVTVAVALDGGNGASIGIEEARSDVTHKLPNEYLDLDWIPKEEKVLLLPATEFSPNQGRIVIADSNSELYRYILRQGVGCRLTIRTTIRLTVNGETTPTVFEEDVTLSQWGDNLDCEYTAAFQNGLSVIRAEIVAGDVSVVLYGDSWQTIEIYGHECNDVPIGAISSLKYLQAVLRGRVGEENYTDNVLAVGSVYDDGAQRYVTSLLPRYVRDIPDDIENYAETYYDYRDLPSFHSIMMVYNKLKSELDTALGSYIADIDALIGGEK